jgi:hypothetical protein
LNNKILSTMTEKRLNFVIKVWAVIRGVPQKLYRLDVCFV